MKKEFGLNEVHVPVLPTTWPRSLTANARTDLFSFGVVLYEMATGTLPFKGETSAAICNAILNETPVPPARINAEIPSKLADIVSRALEKDRDFRYQSASDTRSELKRFKRDTDFRPFGSCECYRCFQPSHGIAVHRVLKCRDPLG